MQSVTAGTINPWYDRKKIIQYLDNFGISSHSLVTISFGFFQCLIIKYYLFIFIIINIYIYIYLFIYLTS